MNVHRGAVVTLESRPGTQHFLTWKATFVDEHCTAEGVLRTFHWRPKTKEPKAESGDGFSWRDSNPPPAPL